MYFALFSVTVTVLSHLGDILFCCPNVTVSRPCRLSEFYPNRASLNYTENPRKRTKTVTTGIVVIRYFLTYNNTRLHKILLLEHMLDSCLRPKPLPILLDSLPKPSTPMVHEDNKLNTVVAENDNDLT